MSKSVTIHLGYHKTGSSSLQKWLADHAALLEPHLLAFNLADGSSNPLKFAVHRHVMGQGPAEDIALECRRIRDAIRASPQPRVCITDEGLLGLPLGFSAGNFIEDAIYPRAKEIVTILARELAEFSPRFVVFERDREAWLRSVHNQMHKQGCVSEDFDGFIARFRPEPAWARLREELQAGIGGNGQLVTCNFETEFAKPTISQMALFQCLDLPEEVMAEARPTLERINASVPLAIRAPRRQAIVLGGSNSMIANGWINRLRRDFSRLIDIQNLSVGACTSAMALYRYLSLQGRPAGVPVIWEYGINEYNHFEGGQSLDSLILHVEWLLQICIREDRPFLPVMMYNRSQLTPEPDAYARAIRDLFARYGLEVLDCTRLLQIVARGAPELGRWYSDGAHYDTASVFPERLAEHVLMALERARVPTCPEARAARFNGRDLALASPDGADTAHFENSVLSCDFTPFDKIGEIDLPGRPLAAFLITSGTGPKIRFDRDDARFGPVSTQVRHGAGIPPRQLRQLVFPDGFGTAGPGTPLRVEIDDSDAAPVVQNMFCWQTPAEEAHANGLVALLCETGPT
ncbi:sulfotransferase family protein [Alterinioella nitratireducens]|uniref:hypothetical protein n=1 Tax=Alterinioella nitratireducens TaxID=2735915 RepID=UPI001556BD9E|nr:hypothetical protein [Alterinioella nitratireducens]NPD21294.1 hypothetical protein [Alterinioella nitratireducens]